MTLHPDARGVDPTYPKISHQIPFQSPRHQKYAALGGGIFPGTVPTKENTFQKMFVASVENESHESRFAFNSKSTCFRI